MGRGNEQQTHFVGLFGLDGGGGGGMYNGRFLPHTHLHCHTCAANGTAVGLAVW
ncbi:MAG: hypothetical protein KBE23_05435 [Chloroflexi bacterium]|nr:hypothetical protein [Chloroflexota bacterium]MBP7042163.1 hypothetical protein [Chloroflexota bacterium]